MGPLDPVEPMEAPGTVIGRYKLLEKIGEGGMAVVYMAEQTEPIRRKVALKIIKLGRNVCSTKTSWTGHRINTPNPSATPPWKRSSPFATAPTWAAKPGFCVPRPCELRRGPGAVAEYDQALALTPREQPQYLDLATQRYETLLRTGRYEHVVTTAQEMLQLWLEKPVFQYHLFAARTALGDCEKAAVVCQEIIRSTSTARNQFWFWATKYVFDTLEAGRLWHRGVPAPTGAAFLPLVEAEETYRDLSAKAHRVVTNGCSAQWSPDGKKLAFSLGVQGYSGVALYDPATKETELLIVPGKDPRWSPDGRYLAFVRDRQALRLEELTSTERKDQERGLASEEVWVMRSNGTEPRRLARGGWPSWSRDSAQVYCHSRQDKMLCSISNTTAL